MAKIDSNRGWPDGSLHLWYAGLARGDTDLGHRICSARFSGPLSIGA